MWDMMGVNLRFMNTRSYIKLCVCGNWQVTYSILPRCGNHFIDWKIAYVRFAYFKLEWEVEYMFCHVGSIDS